MCICVYVFMRAMVLITNRMREFESHLFILFSVQNRKLSQKFVGKNLFKFSQISSKKKEKKIQTKTHANSFLQNLSVFVFMHYVYL